MAYSSIQKKMKWRKDNKGRECIKRAAKRYRSRPEIKERTNNYKRVRRQELKEETLSHYSQQIAQCAVCGEKRLDCLSIDHINGGGVAHRRSLGGITGGSEFYKWLKRNNYPSGYQVLCMNCQFIKEHVRRRHQNV